MQKTHLEGDRREEAEDDEALFDTLMGYVGRDGKFQNRFNLVFNLGFVLFIAMPYINLMLALTVPDHWCHVPGRELTNLTLQQWKQLTLPREIDTRGTVSYSKCTMYNMTLQELQTSENSAENNTRQIIGCRYGWDYDTTWYSRTAATQQDWVCDKDLYVTNTFVFSRAGDVIGTFVFGQLGDLIGRRPVFFITLATLCIGRCLTAATSSHFPLFLLATVLGSLSQSAAFQSPLVLGMEMSPTHKRAHIAMLQCLGWTVGICVMPLIAWVTRDWVIFLVLTSVPCAVFCLCFSWFPESARWLAAKGRIGRCSRELHLIARVNGFNLPGDDVIMLSLSKMAARRERIYGPASLFSSWRLAKNTLLVVHCWVANSVTYYTLLLSISSMSGNPFLNFFWQSLVELPGYIVGKVLSDRIGRRWTQTLMFLLVSVSLFLTMLTVEDPALETATTCLVVLVKFGITVTFYVVHLVAMETYPTCVRQSGTSMGSVMGSGMGILGPYIVYLGTVFDVRYPYLVMGLLSLSGAVAGSFLPETLHQNLPETLADAQNFGKEQRYWSLPSKRKSETQADVLEASLNS